MKILYDHQIFGTQKYGGISRYFFQLIKHLHNTKATYELSLKYSKNAYILNDPGFSVKEDIKTDGLFGYKFRGSARLLDILGRLSIVNNPRVDNVNNTIDRLKSSDFDIFHPTAYGDYFSPHLKRPFVLTVYDMIHEVFLDNPLERSYKDLIARKKALINMASHIIAISENTKRDIIRMCNVDAGKVTVIYLANSLESAKTEEIDLPVPDNYILFVGDRHAYKNFEFFVTSIGSLLKKNTDLFLVCAGSKNFTPKEISVFEKLNITSQVIYFPFIDDNVLINLYRRAICFVFPTLYEGFGIPVLEAFACDCPAVISNTSSLPEVAGDAGMYFDPEDTSSIFESIEKVIHGPEIRKEMINKGRDRLKNFSWDKCARETVSVYEGVL